MSRLFSKWYDRFMSPLEKKRFKKIRKDLLKKAEGKILEIGSGTGVNFPFYRAVENVMAIEPSEDMIKQSISKKKAASVPIEIIHAGAERLPFANHSFDTVVATLVFCTIPDVDKALAEINRVCKPEGKILLFEHVRMHNPLLAHMQDWLTPYWEKICDGCCLNRETEQSLNKHGYEILHIKKFYRGLFIAVELKKGSRPSSLIVI